MSLAQKKIFTSTRSFSSLAATSVLLLSLVFSQLIDESTITWQVVIALIALAIGIPHGALDHLVTLPRSSIVKMTLFIALMLQLQSLQFGQFLTGILPALSLWWL